MKSLKKYGKDFCRFCISYPLFIVTIGAAFAYLVVIWNWVSPNANIPLLILIILAALLFIEFAFYYHRIHFRKENTTEKKTNNTRITIMENMPLLKRFDVILETRNFEIQMLWKRSNYFLALNTAIAVGFVSLIKEDAGMETYIYALLFCVIGCVVCLAWFKVNLGSKFWQAVWEEFLTEISSDMGLDYFAKSDDHKERVKNNLGESSLPFGAYYNPLVLEKPSVSKWMTGLSFFFLLVWFCVGGFISYNMGELTIGVNALIIWILFWLVVRVIFGLFKIIPKTTQILIIIVIVGYLACLAFKPAYCYC